MPFIDLVSERLEELDPHVLDRCADKDNNGPCCIEINHEAIDACILSGVTIQVDEHAVSTGAKDLEKVMEGDKADEEDQAKDGKKHHVDDLNDVVDITNSPAVPLEAQDNKRDARDQ